MGWGNLYSWGGGYGQERRVPGNLICWVDSFIVFRPQIKLKNK